MPSNPYAWGIEDKIAGHLKRYTKESLIEVAEKNNLKIITIGGLTWPLSNLLLPISNLILKNNNIRFKNKSLFKRTAESGNLHIKFKTKFPFWWNLFCNTLTLFPFHLLQMFGYNKSTSLVLYCEMTRK